MSPSGVVRWSVSTPEGTVAHGEAEFLVVPTIGGELGVMADHAALITRLAAGELRVTSGGAVKSVPVGPGLVEVRDNTVRLLLSGAPPSQP
jgi:F-type H+-transporting ATPase subunit epsilon